MNKLKYSMLVLVAFSLSMSFAMATHDADADLQPEWSPAGMPVDYDVTISNNGPDSIDEFRIYINPEYTDVTCEEEPGWLLAEFPIYVNNQIIQVCQYNTNSSNVIPEGGDLNFEFTATVPDSGCNLEWRFETRDEETSDFGAWNVIFDSTSVDDKAPILTKTVDGTQWMDGELCPNGPGEGEECWITQETTIGVMVVDDQEGQCSPPSLVDYCDVSVLLDEGYDTEEVIYDETWYAPDCDVDVLLAKGMTANQIIEQCGEIHETIQWDEDSIHDLTITCYDHAGNMFTDTERFRVDNTPPTTEKFHDGPFYEDENSEWIDTVSEIRLESTDGGEICHIDMEKTYYQNHWLQGEGEIYCAEAAACARWETSSHEDEDWTLYEGPFSGGEESCHVIEYYSVDGLGNKEDVKWECTYVDKTPPAIEKIVDEPKVPLCDARPLAEYTQEFTQEDMSNDAFDVTVTKSFDGANYKWVVEMDESTIAGHWSTGAQVLVDSFDGTMFLLGWSPGESTSEPIYKEYDGSWGSATALPAGMSVSGNYNEAYYEIIVPAEYMDDCNFGWTINTEASWPDHSSSEQQIYPFNDIRWYKEGAARESAHNGLDWYVTTGTDIELMCEDQEPHPSGQETIFWTSYKWDGNDWVVMEDESMQTNSYTFNFGEVSRHKLEWFCQDAVEKTSETDLEYFYVDDEAPIITKEVNGPQEGICPPAPGSDDVCYIQGGVTEVVVSVADTEADHMSNNVMCEYEVIWNNGLLDFGTFGEEGKTFVWDEDSAHELRIVCEDALGNPVRDVETFLVDMVPPESWHEIGPEETVYTDGETGALYVDSATRVTLDAEDAKVGLDEIEYRISGSLGDQYCISAEACGNWMNMLRPAMGDFMTYSEPFGFEEESCHVVEYRSVDLFGNEEEINWFCAFVDKTAPVVSLETVGEPMILSSDIGDATSDYWVTTASDIELTCDFGVEEPHPAPLNMIYWQIKVDEGEFGDVMEAPIGQAWLSFEEDSYHTLKYWCDDMVGKVSEEVTTVFRVDTTEPSIELSLYEPYFGDCENLLDEHDECFVDTATRLEVTTVDGGEICAIGGETCEWRYKVNDGEFSDWMFYNETEMISFPEESYHTLEVKCADALGNENVVSDRFSVDKTAPGIWKEYSTYYSEEFETFWAKWTAVEAPIYAGVTDDGPHMSGISEVKYKVSMAENDDDCKYYYEEVIQQDSVGYNPDIYSCDEASEDGWTLVDSEEFGEFMFDISEESCHVIEIMATDNVGKCNLHKQWVYVDDTAPTPYKTVGAPSTTLENNEYTWQFYPEVNGQCWEENGIDCWKVTKMTPVSMECVDEEPHPVGYSRVFFMVEWDGDDVTEEYCELYDGEYNYSGDGYCRVSSELENFYFNEVSEHNLKYYCEDALGNVGEVDDEMFKVEETAFTIELNKKWNLISVPVKLLDNSIEEVFEPIADQVISVWQFNGVTQEWKVYSPNGDSSDDSLHTLEPGWGYWVLANEDTTLHIGGEVISGGTSNLEVPVGPGWNLIGYYGVDDGTEEGKESYTGPVDVDWPVGTTKPAVCALTTIEGALIDTNTPSLTTWWEPMGGEIPLRVGYLYEINPPNQIPSNEINDWMDAGAGYWLYYSGDGEAGYAPSTHCKYMPPLELEE